MKDCLALRSSLTFLLTISAECRRINNSRALLRGVRGEAKAPRPAEPPRRSGADTQASPALCQAADLNASLMSSSLVMLFLVEMLFALPRCPLQQWDAQPAVSKDTE